MRRALALLGVLAVALLGAPAAHAAAVIDRAAQALRDDPVYVDPDAEAAISGADADRLRRAIDEQGAGPMYIAILPESAKRAAGGSVRGVGGALEQALHRDGTYAIVAGHSFAGGDTAGGAASQAARDALEAHKDDGAMAILLDFVDRVGALQHGAGAGSGGGGAFAVIVLVLVVAGGALLIVSRRRARKRREEAFAEVKDNARDDLVALGGDIRALDLDVEMPGADPEATAAYGRAVEAYDRADRAWEVARTPEDLEPVATALEGGRYEMAVAKARMEGRPVPERRPPCFFDPRHGPSDREVEWAPPGGTPRPVPACEADAQRVERGDDPHAREVTLGGRPMPYWNAGPMYAPFAGGYFGGAGGMLGGFAVGTLLGEALAPGLAWGAGDWGGGGGDFGGGDFGGGDFGGGDFGGGDFGGGDF